MVVSHFLQKKYLKNKMKIVEKKNHNGVLWIKLTSDLFNILRGCFYL